MLVSDGFMFYHGILIAFAFMAAAVYLYFVVRRYFKNRTAFEK